jgi:hypothetical protein
MVRTLSLLSQVFAGRWLQPRQRVLEIHVGAEAADLQNGLLARLHVPVKLIHRRKRQRIGDQACSEFGPYRDGMRPTSDQA